jgi:formiminotetrahydrofolate cyclodeaminase
MPPLASLPFAELLEALAARTPTPGGGAAACIAGALAAAQAEMVVAFSIGKRHLADHQPRLEAARGALRRTRDLLLRLADEDAAAYGALSELERLPEADPRRRAEHGPALERAVNVPRAALAACANLLRLLEELGPITNRPLRSDLGIAAVLAEAAARACDWNVRINASSLPEGALKSAALDETRRELGEAARRCERVQEACAV